MKYSILFTATVIGSVMAMPAPKWVPMPGEPIKREADPKWDPKWKKIAGEPYQP